MLRICTTIEFYRDCCGLGVVQEHGEGPNDHVVWIAAPGRKKDFVVALLLGGTVHIQRDSDLSHFGFAVVSRQAVDEIARRNHETG